MQEKKKIGVIYRWRDVSEIGVGLLFVDHLVSVLSDLGYGDSIEQFVDHLVENVDLVLVLLYPGALKICDGNSTDFFAWEIQTLLEREKKLVPLLLDYPLRELITYLTQKPTHYESQARKGMKAGFCQIVKDTKVIQVDSETWKETLTQEFKN